MKPNTINSMESLQEYLKEHPESAPDLFYLIIRLGQSAVSMGQQVSRDLLLREADRLDKVAIPCDAREFIAKRIFAFWKKGLLSVLQQRVSGWQSLSSSIEQALDMLFFEGPLQQSLPVADGILTSSEEPARQSLPAVDGIPSQNLPAKEEVKAEKEPGLKEEEPIVFKEQLKTKEEPIHFKEELAEKEPGFKEEEPIVFKEQLKTKEEPIHFKEELTEKEPGFKEEEPIVFKEQLKTKEEPIEFRKQIETKEEPKRKEELKKIERKEEPSQIRKEKEEKSLKTEPSKRESKKMSVILEEDAAKIRQMEGAFAEQFGVTLESVDDKEFAEEYSKQTLEEIEKSYRTLDETNIPVIDVAKHKEIIEKEITKLAPQHLVRILNGIMSRYFSKTQEKYPLMRIKDACVRHHKTITNSSTLFVFLNYGMKVTQSLLQKFSTLSNVPELNHAVYQYLTYGLEQELEEHGKMFRQTVEHCPSKDEFLRVLAQYPLRDASLIEHYPALQIIQSLKFIAKDFEHGMQDITGLLNRHLGPGEANMKRFLNTILVKRESQEKIHDDLNEASDINSLFKHIQSLKDDPEMRGTAETLFQMVVMFLRGKQRVSFQTFKTSLNFLSPGLQGKVIAVVRKKLTKDMENRISSVLEGQGNLEKRWKKLMQILQNPQFSDLKLFGYTIAEIFHKIQNILSQENAEKVIGNILPKTAIPEALRQMILQKHDMDSTVVKKTVHTCREDLADLKDRYFHGKVPYLKRSLTDLFQIYGNVELGISEGVSVKGYDLSRSIANYYHNPSRGLTLPQNVDTMIGEMIQSMISDEWARRRMKQKKPQ